VTECFFVSDLHGGIERYEKLLGAVRLAPPDAVFIGGDILPSLARSGEHPDFIQDYLLPRLESLRTELGPSYPKVFVILGNDDPRIEEEAIRGGEARGLLLYMHMRKEPLEQWTVYGYAMTSPSPFRLKDWERYDVSRYVDPGSVSPEEGVLTVPVPPDELRFGTIAEDLQTLAGSDDLGNAVMLFHAPPYRTSLDRAPLDEVTVDHVALDVHIGSIAIRRFIEERKPLVTLHGHAHESARLTGWWRERIGRTLAFSAAHDGPELALVRFDLENPEGAVRELR
jgi:Icc-related predicted phosphoesterase